jgi:small ligand-binding sensory domain FIST
MAVRIGSGLSTGADERAAAVEAALEARTGLEGADADLVLVFASGGHLVAPEATLEGVSEALAPELLVGCGACGVLASGREIESDTAVAVWAASLGDSGSAEAFVLTSEETEEGEGAIEVSLGALPELGDASAVILLADPYSFPAEGALSALHESAPGVPVLGGLASARTADGAAALFHDVRLVENGAVGVVLRGVEILPCVSQGAMPLGRALTVTSAEANIVRELDGRPALATLQEAITALPPEQQALVAGGVLIGLGVDGDASEDPERPFVVRGVLGADPDSGALAIGAVVESGQVVRLHARDAASADADLRAALDLRREALGGATPAGALLFTCNGRGRGMFGVADHDAGAVADALGSTPTAGFFAAGEIGPVGGLNFLHGFTATVAVFAR